MFKLPHKSNLGLCISYAPFLKEVIDITPYTPKLGSGIALMEYDGVSYYKDVAEDSLLEDVLLNCHGNISELEYRFIKRQIAYSRCGQWLMDVKDIDRPGYLVVHTLDTFVVSGFEIQIIDERLIRVGDYTCTNIYDWVIATMNFEDAMKFLTANIGDIAINICISLVQNAVRETHHLLMNGDFTDFTITTAGGEYKVHKYIMSQSPFFKELFISGAETLHMVEEDSIVENAILCVYGDNCKYKNDKEWQKTYCRLMAQWFESDELLLLSQTNDVVVMENPTEHSPLDENKS